MEVYMTINKVNNKKYIGKLCSKGPNYLGSGVYLKSAIKKYGKENFERITIEKVDTKELLSEREKYWIEYYDAVNDPNYYNLTQGGHGSFSHTHTQEAVKKRVDKVYGPILTPPQGAVFGQTLKKYKVIHQGEEFVGTLEECKKKFDIEHSMFFGLLRGGHKNPYKYKDMKVVPYNETYYLIEGKRYDSTSAIKEEFGVKSYKINFRINNKRIDWWKIEKVI